MEIIFLQGHYHAKCTIICVLSPFLFCGIIMSYMYFKANFPPHSLILTESNPAPPMKGIFASKALDRALRNFPESYQRGWRMTERLRGEIHWGFSKVSPYSVPGKWSAAKGHV